MNVGEHYQRLFQDISPAFAFSADTPEALQRWQESFRAHLRDLLGLTRMEASLSGHEPRAERLETVALDGYTRERWQMWPEPTLSFTYYVLKPQGAGTRTPLALTPHGHGHPHIYVGLFNNDRERAAITEGERDIAVQAVKEGYTVISPTVRGFGETRTEKDCEKSVVSSCRTQLMHGLLLGRTPVGERVWDMSRLIDWAISNLEIDPARIAITGSSGGGLASLFAGACDQRISVVVPSCYFCTFRGSIGAVDHCDCNYVPGILQAGEMYDVAGLIAPRPFCAIAGERDHIFPIGEVRLAFEKLQHIYRVAGVPERCRLYVGDGGHRYYKAGCWPFVREFI